jgi:prepilin-type N-terminal cleavage/methylation domain-containing protein
MRKGFTLIELLVVVSIIALLIAILLPVLSNVQYSVKVDICKNNLRQVGIGVFAYTVDSKEYYPNGYIENGTTNVDGMHGRDTDYSWAVYQRRSAPRPVPARWVLKTWSRSSRTTTAA